MTKKTHNVRTEENPNLAKATKTACVINGSLALTPLLNTQCQKNTGSNNITHLDGQKDVHTRIQSAFTSDHNKVLPTKDAMPRFDLSRLTLGSTIVSADYTIVYLVDKLIPENSIILLYAKGGSGKSTVATQIAASILSCNPFMGLATIQRPIVVVDYENPLAVLSKRITAVDGAGDIHFWTGGNSPPQLNHGNWQDLKLLVTTLKNPLIIIDTLSSACSELDILSNGHFAPIMKRIVDLRNLGATIILLHHTPKLDETKYIGASCIYNQSDHILAMYPVKMLGSQQETTDEDDVKVYRLGTVDKTRFGHYAMYIQFDEEKSCFVPAPDPDKEILERLSKIISENEPVNQSTIINKCGQFVSKSKLMRLLKQNEGSLWNVEKGDHNAKIYRSVPFSSFPHLYSEKTEQRGSEHSAQVEKTEYYQHFAKALKG